MIAYLKDFKKLKKAVATIGSFDGVHLGHLALLNLVKDTAHEVGGTPMVITFEPHPRLVTHKEQTDFFVLNTAEEKYTLIKNYGIENICVINFDKDFSDIEANDFIENILIEKLGIETLILGYDHHFGRNREGNYELLKKYQDKGKINLIKIPPVIKEAITISSTAIRRALKESKLDIANRNLGYAYSFSGTVVEGKKIGHTIGFATANIKLDYKHKLIPENGVYIVQVFLNNKKYNAMMNIGLQPTFGETQQKIEVHILNFNENIYGQKLTVQVFKKLRETKKFTNVHELVAQLNIDKENTETFFKNFKL